MNERVTAQYPFYCSMKVQLRFNDIDMGGATLAPVPTYAATFDGQGHKIYNFKVESADAVTGLFLSNAGTIKDVVFGSKDGSAYDGVSTIGSADGKGGGFTGLVAVNDGTLENVTTFVKINYVAAAAEAEVGVGGLVGNAVLNSVLRGCVNKAVITAAGEPTQVTDFGGLIGYMNQPARVENCSNEAEISLSIPVKKVLHIGGLVGRINAAATVENSHNKADVSYRQEVAPSTWMSIGGVIGSDYNGGSVTGCSNKGNIFANTLQVVRIGGIMGVLNKSGKVENCTNEGSVTLEQEANANWQSAGGIIGFQEASQTNEKDNIVKGNTNKGAVTVTVENTTGHANKVAAGGILGEGCLALSVTDNVNLAPVKVTNKAAGPVYAGGIYGALIKNKVEILSSGNINAGSVTAATSDNAQAMAGGVVGYIAPASGGDANTVVITLTGDKSTGDVTGTAAMAGAAAGNNCNGALEACIVGGSVKLRSLRDEVCELLFLAELQRFRHAHVDAVRNLTAVDQVRASVAFLRDFQLGVPVHRAERAQVHQVLQALCLDRVYADKPVVAFRDDFRIRFHQRARIALLAHDGLVFNVHFRYLTVRGLLDLHPEMPRIGLRQLVGQPLVADVFVFARDLATVASVAPRLVDNENLSHYSLLHE